MFFCSSLGHYSTLLPSKQGGIRSSHRRNYLRATQNIPNDNNPRICHRADLEKDIAGASPRGGGHACVAQGHGSLQSGAMLIESYFSTHSVLPASLKRFHPNPLHSLLKSSPCLPHPPGRTTCHGMIDKPSPGLPHRAVLLLFSLTGWLQDFFVSAKCRGQNSLLFAHSLYCVHAQCRMSLQACRNSWRPVLRSVATLEQF